MIFLTSCQMYFMSPRIQEIQHHLLLCELINLENRFCLGACYLCVCSPKTIMHIHKLSFCDYSYYLIIYIT